jgi:chemotaxis protein MotB
MTHVTPSQGPLRSVRLPLLAAAAVVFSACVPWSAYQKSEHQNTALKQEAVASQGQAQDSADQVAALSDKSTDLALQNHFLKIDNEDLKQEARDRDAFYDSVTQDLRQQVGAGRLKIIRYKDLLTLDVTDEILFDSASAGLKPEGREVLRQVGKAVAKSDKSLRVVGYTDNEALAKGAGFASNWELSTARATTVVRFLQEECGLDPKRLLAAGRGEWMPIATNSTAAGRQQNRRITITLVDRDLQDEKGAL